MIITLQTKKKTEVILSTSVLIKFFLKMYYSISPVILAPLLILNVFLSASVSK